jgi:hypothetical protein
MSQVSVQVEGLKGFVRSLEKAGVEVDDLKDVFGAVAAEGAKVAAGFTPTDTGALRNTVRGNRAKNKAVVMFGKGRVKYAGPILYGWPKRNIVGSRTIAKTDDVLSRTAPQMLDQGLNKVLADLGLKD